MGDRAHVKVKQRDGDLYLYTHWTGYKVGADIIRGLSVGQDRWDDDEYLARILFDAIKGDDVTGTTGYGISVSQPDGVQWVVDISRQEVVNPSGEIVSFTDLTR